MSEIIYVVKYLVTLFYKSTFSSVITITKKEKRKIFIHNHQQEALIQ